MRTMLAAAAVVILCGSSFAADDMRGFFPGPQEVAGWAMSASIETYEGAKIYDFIDGAGEVFMKYNFEVVSAVEYKGPQDAVISVEVYRMKTPEDAYGVFAYHKPAKAETLAVTQAGYVSGMAAGVWRNVHYVKIQGIEEKPGVAEAVREFAKSMAGKIPGEGNLPLLFKVLEVDGLQKGSVKFARSNLPLKNLHFVADDDVLKLDQGAQIVFGDYVLQKRSFKAFAILYATEAAAREAAAAYAKALGANAQAEATWFKQSGKVIAGVWTGLKVAETQDSESMMYETIGNILNQVKTYQLEK